MRRKYLVIFTTAVLSVSVFVSAVILTTREQARRAGLAFDAADYGAASADFARAAQLMPWRDDLWESAALASALGGDPQTAFRFLEHVDDFSEQGWAALGYAHYLAGEHQQAIQAFREGLRHADSWTLYAGLRLVHSAQKDREAEREALENMLRLNPQDAFGQYRLALLLTRLDPSQAADPLDAAARLDSNYSEAAATLREALRGGGTAAAPTERRVRIGRALGLVGEWELAREVFQEAVALDPADGQAWAWLGEARQQTGEDGLEALDRALELDPDSTVVRGLRGLYWSRRGNPGRTLAEYQAAAEIEPHNPAWRAALGESQRALGDLVAAFESFQAAAALAPQDPTYWRLLAVFCAENGVHMEEAGLPAARKAVELAPSDPSALDALGFAYYVTGKYAHAGRILLQATEADPGYLPAQLHLALNDLAQGNATEAQARLIRIRDLDPQGESGAYAVRLLEQFFP